MDLINLTYFDEQLKLQSIYRISGFVCQYTRPYQQTLANKISLRFGRATSFVPLPGKETEFSDHHFEFVAHNQLPSSIPYRDNSTGKMIYPILTDYMGCIRSMSEIMPSGDVLSGQKYRKKVEIESLDGIIVEFTMWDELAYEFDKVEFNKLAFPAILAVTACKVSRFRDLMQLSATSTTHFYINPRTEEVKDAYTLFKQKYSSGQPLQVVRYPYVDLEQEKKA